MGIHFARYTGINDVRSVHYSTGADGLPGIATLIIRPQPYVPAGSGVLEFGDGNRSPIRLVDCIIDRASMEYTTEGHVGRVHVFDRSWRWEFRVIDGIYNVPSPKGGIIEATKKSAQDLARLLLTALGEQSSTIDVGALPLTYPFVNWRCDDARAELSWLCRLYGCTWALDPVSDSVRIWRIGQGTEAPATNDTQSSSFAVVNPPGPDDVRVCFGDTIFQSKLELECVMPDNDETFSIIPYESVNYAPDGGWDGRNPFEPLPPPPLTTEELNYELAKKYLYRLWRVKQQATGDLVVPGYGPVPSIEYILPLRDTLALPYTNEVGLEWEPDAYLEGTFATGGNPPPLLNAGPFAHLDTPPGAIRIDGYTGLVHSNFPIYKWDNRLQTAADLYLVTSYRVNDAATFAKVKSTYTQHLQDHNGGTLAVRRPDLELRIAASYGTGENGGTVQSTSSNEQALISEVQNISASVSYQFAPRTGKVIRYRGVQTVFRNGVIRQITWKVSTRDHDCGSWTWVAENTEWEPGMPYEHERRRVLQSIIDESRKEMGEFGSKAPPIRVRTKVR